MNDPVVNITINGQAIKAKSGQTVLDAATAAGIYIPNLCHHPELKPEGACRLCLVEIEKQRTLHPACTYPVQEGMVVRTETPAIVESRKFSLQMIFSERNHYCMFCPQSGDIDTTDCELQKLGYHYGLTSWAFTPDYAKSWPIDATRKYFIMDHSRCILCRRCVRACASIAANHTLGVHQRGARTLICADDDVPFAESSCVSCGTCLQVCPTGALIERNSAFVAHESQLQRTPAACMGCAVGCGIIACTRDNHLLRIEGDWTATNGGLLCSAGRFESVEPRPRILWPLVRQEGKLVETSWDKALTLVASRFKEARRVAGLASPRSTNESLAVFGCFFHEVLESNELGLLYGDVPPLDLGRRATLKDLAAADCIVIIGGDPLENQRVAGYLIKRAYRNDATIILIHDTLTTLEPYATLSLPLQDISHGQSPFEQFKTTYHLRGSGVHQLKTAVEAASRPVVLYGSGLSTTVYAALRALPPKTGFLPLIEGANAAGAARLGLHAHPVRGDALFVLLGDDSPPADQPLPQRNFTVVQAAHRSAWTDAADVVLPAQLWSEQKGHFINLEGATRTLLPLQQPPASVQANWEAMLRLSVRMGYALSFDEITDITAAV